MVKLSRIPVAAPPTAPARVSTGRLLLRAYIIIVFAAAFGHSAVYNLVGHTGSVIVMAVITAGTLAIWVPAIVRGRPAPLEWRRLPWAIFGYCALALISVTWSAWPAATLVTAALLLSLTLNALFIAHLLTWRELLGAMASALKWLLGLSIAIEAWVALVIQHPILPFFFDAPAGEVDPHWYWVRGNLLDGGRVQGIVGNSNYLAALCLVAIILFCVLFAARVRWRTTLALWVVVALYLLYRASSATIWAAAVAVAITLAVALLQRRASAPGRRARVYAVALGGTALLVAAAVLWRGPLLEGLGRTGDFTGRFAIWESVLERVASRPVFGWGFSSPWLPSEPAIHGWIVDKGITVFTAHNMWIDVLFQLGAAGLVLMAVIWASLLWRSWFFAVDRPRWDLRADRPFSPLTLAPSLITVMLLVQGLAESSPIMLWGWLLVVLFTFKIKSVPLLGVGLSESARVIDLGEQRRRVP